MSIDRDNWVHVGWTFKPEDFNFLTVTIPEQSHMEKRFSEKTGRRIKDVKIIDQHECTVWKIGDREIACGDMAELKEVLEDLIPDAAIHEFGDWYDGDIRLCIGPDIGEEIGDDGSIPMSIFEKGWKPKLNRIANALRKLGLDMVEGPAIHSLWSVS